MIICHKYQSIIRVHNSFSASEVRIVIKISFIPLPSRPTRKMPIVVLISLVSYQLAGSYLLKIPFILYPAFFFRLFLCNVVIRQLSELFKPPVSSSRSHSCCCTCCHRYNTTFCSFRLHIFSFHYTISPCPAHVCSIEKRTPESHRTSVKPGFSVNTAPTFCGSSEAASDTAPVCPAACRPTARFCSTRRIRKNSPSGRPCRSRGRCC